MTPDQWFVAGRDVVLAVVAILVFYWGKDRKNSEQRIEERFELRDDRIKSLEKRMDSAAEKSSREWGRVTAKIGDLEMRMVALETHLERRRRERGA